MSFILFVVFTSVSRLIFLGLMTRERLIGTVFAIVTNDGSNVTDQTIVAGPVVLTFLVIIRYF